MTENISIRADRLQLVPKHRGSSIPHFFCLLLLAAHLKISRTSTHNLGPGYPVPVCLAGTTLNKFNKEKVRMKKLLTLLFAIAIALSLTTATFGQDSTMKKDDKK